MARLDPTYREAFGPSFAKRSSVDTKVGLSNRSQPTISCAEDRGSNHLLKTDARQDGTINRLMELKERFHFTKFLPRQMAVDGGNPLPHLEKTCSLILICLQTAPYDFSRSLFA